MKHPSETPLSRAPYRLNAAMIKPLEMLKQSRRNPVLVELRAGRAFRGILEGYDPHMNLVLKDAEELVNRESVRKTALAVVRGDNVVYISP